MNHPDELISASLTGDITEFEQAQLDQHLRACPECRATLAAFSDQRQVVGGLRHTAPPRDLSARVRTGIEAGAFADLPWWRRPSGVFAGIAGFAALAAGALLGFAVLNAAPENPPVGADTPTPVVTPTASASSTPPPPSVTPSPSPSPTATPSPSPTPTPAVIGFGTINYLAMSGTRAGQDFALYGYRPDLHEDSRVLTLDPAVEVPGTVSFSPDYEWLVYQTEPTPKGTRTIRVISLVDGQELTLGEAPGGDPFAERMTWSLDGRFLAYTALNGEGIDVHLFDTESGDFEPITTQGNMYAASFDGERLWISAAGQAPVSYLVPLDADLTDLATASTQRVDRAFLPLLAPTGERVIFWRGTMAEQPTGSWSFSTGGMPYVADGVRPADFDAARQLFPELTAAREAFLSAEIVWGYDGDSFAVWNVSWTGVPQTDSEGGPFPDPTAVYAGRASSDNLIARDDALRFAAADERILDVTFVGYDFGSPDISDIAVTIFEASGGESGDSPIPEARLMISPTRGIEAAFPIGGEEGWIGPALYIVQPGDLAE